MIFGKAKYFILALNCVLFSKDTTFVREYSYIASKFDTKETARELSINEAKTILLEEIGVYIKSELSTNIRITEDANNFNVVEFDEQKITSLTAGITKTKIVEEKWDEKKWLKDRKYWVKLEITLNPDSIQMKIQKVLDKKELLADLEESRKLIAQSKKELQRLENQLTFSNEKNLDLQKQYNKQINTIYVTKYIENGIQYLNENNLIEAESQFKKCVKIAPDNPTALQNLGYIHFINGDYQNAKNLFLRLIEINPNYSYPYHYLGHIYFKSGAFDEALKQYKKAIRVRVSWVRVFLLCATACVYPITLFYFKKYKILSIRYVFYENFPEIRKFYFFLFLSLIHLLILINYKEIVEKNIKETLQNKYYSNSYAYDNIGLVYQALGKHSKSIKLFEKALNIKPDYIKSHINLGNSYFKLDNYELSIDSYNNAIKIDPNDATIYHKIGEVYLKIDDHERALEMFNLSSKIDTMYAPSYWSRGEIYENRGENSIALKFYETSVKKFQSTNYITPYELQNLYYKIGLLYLKIEDTISMTDAFKKASELDSDFFQNWIVRKRKSKNLLNQEYTSGYEIVDHNFKIVKFYSAEALSGQGLTKSIRLKNAKKSANRWLNKLKKDNYNELSK